MVEITSQARQWGRSIGIVIPNETVKKANIKAGDEIRLFIVGKNNPLQETFGTLKPKRPTEQILKEVDRELWNE